MRVYLGICATVITTIAGVHFLVHPSEQIRVPVTPLSSNLYLQSASKPTPDSRIPTVQPAGAIMANSTTVETRVPPAPIRAAAPIPALTTPSAVSDHRPLGSATANSPGTESVTGAPTVSLEHQSAGVRLSEAEFSALLQSASKPTVDSRIPTVKPASEATVANSSMVETPVPPAPIPALTSPSVVLDHQPVGPATAIFPAAESVTGASAVSLEHQSAGVRLSEEEVSALRARGDALFRAGDVVSARLFYERAAEGGDGRAALQLGETYDPAFLSRAGISGIRGDGVTAERWYQHASELGASEAQILLKSATGR
jgi:hypothetical protein